jgi:glycosyltransferase involved in cell wall biosynthesis
MIKPSSGTNEMKVSIIIPCLKDRGHLDTAIKSAVGQDYDKPFEVILASDGNHDLRQVADRHKIRYVENFTRGGLGQNVNNAVIITQGDYYKILPDDDVLPPDSIRLLAGALDASGADVVHGNAINFKGLPPIYKGNPANVHIPRIKTPTLKDLVKKNHIHGGSTMYLRQAHIDVGGWDEEIQTGEEFEFHLRLLSKGKKIAYIDRVVFYYRIHSKGKSQGARTSPEFQRRVKVISAFREKYRNLSRQQDD